MTKDEKMCRKAIAMLLDHAVIDYERDDKCIEAVEFAMNVLREKPNKKTVEAMKEFAQ
jgi:hypothetical protein